MKLLSVSNIVGAFTLTLGAVGAAVAAPAYDNFGSLAATFAGSGIPNGAVASSLISNNGVLGLTATQRYSNPTVTNNGAGLFFAPTGVDQTNLTSIAGNYARWNFGYYIDNGNNTGLTYQLFMDVNPNLGQSFVSFGPSAITGVNQDSWNLGFNSFESGLGYSFDPTVDGVYTLKLTASDDTGAQVAMTSIDVQVGQGRTVPEPATLALVGLAIAGMGVARRRKS
jgi:hypothetical protein